MDTLLDALIEAGPAAVVAVVFLFSTVSFTLGFWYAKVGLPWLWDRGLRSLAVALPALTGGFALVFIH